MQESPMMLDQSWKIASLVGLLAVLRIVWGLWRKAPARRFSIELLDSGLIAFLLVFVVIRPFVVQAFYIPSMSMERTLLTGDRILVNKFVYRLNPPRRGDVIVFEAPPQAGTGAEKKDFVKRLIGLPGDKIQVRRGEGVYVNGRRLLEPPEVDVPDYDWPLDEMSRPSRQPYVVPKGYYFVLGDNRNISSDSHRWSDPETGKPEPGLAANRMLGKAMVIFWPLTRIRLAGDNRQERLESAPLTAGRGATVAEKPSP
jgi:signal peptidase I